MTRRIAFLAFPPWLLPIVAICMTEIAFLILEILGLSIHGPAIPMGFGLIKDVADVVIIFLFPWHGWVFVIPLLVFFTLDIRFKYLVMTYLLSTISTTLISTFFNFGDLSFKTITMGVLTYAAINAFVFLFLFLLKSMIKGVLKFRQ